MPETAADDKSGHIYF